MQNNRHHAWKDYQSNEVLELCKQVVYTDIHIDFSC